MMRRRNQSGAAILIALMVVGMVALLASSILWRQELWIADLDMQRQRTAARLLARSGTDWARAILAEDARLSAIDHPGEPWASKVPPAPLDGGELGGFLEDQQGKWNLNNLVRQGRVDPLQFELFQRLLEGAGLPVELAFALRDWIDADGERDTSAGAEDEYYLTLPVPYRAGNAPLSHVDELRLVRGFSADVIERLRPLVSALPEFTPVNLNTAPRPVLAAVLRRATDADLDTLVSRRDHLPFRDLADFRGTLQKSAILFEEEILTTASRYFLATITAKQRDSVIELSCMIRRQAGRTEIVWQRYL
jgi:general secretion pathway protein K